MYNSVIIQKILPQINLIFMQMFHSDIDNLTLEIACSQILHESFSMNLIMIKDMFSSRTVVMDSRTVYAFVIAMKVVEVVHYTCMFLCRKDIFFLSLKSVFKGVIFI